MLIDYFKEREKEYARLQIEYSGKCNELMAEYEPLFHRREYAKGIKSVHRGYYCPSPIFDIVVGNTNRGRLLKRLPRKGIYYEYIFDPKDRLICVNEWWAESKPVHEIIASEFLLYSDNKVFSVYYDYNSHTGDESKAITIMSECLYEEGKLIKYEYTLCNMYYGGKGCTEIKTETYKYMDDRLHSCMMDMCNLDVLIVSRDEYVFSHEEEGYLTSYTVSEYDNETKKKAFWDGHVFEVTKKRIV